MTCTCGLLAVPRPRGDVAPKGSNAAPDRKSGHARYGASMPCPQAATLDDLRGHKLVFAKTGVSSMDRKDDVDDLVVR